MHSKVGGGGNRQQVGTCEERDEWITRGAHRMLELLVHSSLWGTCGTEQGFCLRALSIALLSFRECQSDERGEQRPLERNPGNGCQGHPCDPEELCWLHLVSAPTYVGCSHPFQTRGGVAVKWAFQLATNFPIRRCTHGQG